MPSLYASANSSFLSSHFSTESPVDHRRRYRVVLLDDEPSILRAWKKILEVHDVEAVCCGRGEDALAAVAEGCDCLVTDYHMPDMTGVEILLAVRKIAEVPALLMTADDTPAIRQAAMAAGAVGVIAKPAPILKVVEEIERLCDLGLRDL